MNKNVLNNEMKETILMVYWTDVELWGKKNNKSTATYATYELFSNNISNEMFQYYHSLATIELRKQKLNKLWNTIHTLNHQ